MPLAWRIQAVRPLCSLLGYLIFDSIASTNPITCVCALNGSVVIIITHLFIAGAHVMGIPAAVAPTSTQFVSVYTTRRGTTVSDVLHSTMTSPGAMASQAMAFLASYVTVTAMP